MKRTIKTVKVRLVGGALMITVPQAIARLMRIDKGDKIELTANDRIFTAKRVEKQ